LKGYLVRLLSFFKTSPTLNRGAQGEKLAEQFLRRKGLKILEKNFRIRGGEIDIIAEEGDRTVFVEVKTRSTHSFGSAGESIDYYKRKVLRKTALFYLKKKGRPFKARFDVIYVNLQPDNRLQSIEWIENAFPFEE